MRILAFAIVGLVLAPLRAIEPSASAVRQQPTFSPCGPAGTAHVRTTLYFGLTRPSGRVSEDDDTALARATLGELVTAYKQRFEQESVLWESSSVCATF